MLNEIRQAKSTYTSDHEPIKDKEVLVDLELSTTDTSDSDAVDPELESKGAKEQEQDTVRGKSYILSIGCALMD